MLELLKPGVTDLMDIAIVTVILYFLLKFIKGTRALQILIGLLVIFILAVIARLLNLGALSLILNSLGAIWIVALIIVFQPEIRNALARMGRYRAFRIFARSEEEMTITEIVKAVEECKKSKIGFLVVLQREVELGEFIATGIRVDARVSAPLLVSIFTPPSPLHDGACIIKESRIIAAACTLPLSDEPPAEMKYGMRHRAAIGISLVSDACAVVVSEETGKVSVAFQGHLYTDLTITKLKDFLKKIYLPKEEK